MKLELQNIYFKFKNNEKNILSDINIQIYEKNLLSILGPNGSGKTTLLKCICGLYKTYKGKILINNKDITKYTVKNLAQNIAFVPQVLNNRINSTVFDRLILGRRPHISWKFTKKDKKIVYEIAEKLNIIELLSKYINEISGGELQKVYIARALIQQAKILLIDEPTNNLDINHQIEIMSFIKKITKSEKLITIICIHDINLASYFSDKVFLIKEGKKLYFGDNNKVLTPYSIKNLFNIEVKEINFLNHRYFLPAKYNIPSR